MESPPPPTEPHGPEEPAEGGRSGQQLQRDGQPGRFGTASEPHEANGSRWKRLRASGFYPHLLRGEPFLDARATCVDTPTCVYASSHRCARMWRKIEVCSKMQDEPLPPASKPQSPHARTHARTLIIITNQLRVSLSGSPKKINNGVNVSNPQ